MSAALQFRDYGSAPLTHEGEIWTHDQGKRTGDNSSVFTQSHKKWTYEEYGPFHLPQRVVTIAIIALVLAVPGTVMGVTHLIVNSSNKLELGGNGVSSTPLPRAENVMDAAIRRDTSDTTQALQTHSNESKKADSFIVQNANIAPKNDGLHQCDFTKALPGENCFSRLSGKFRVFKFVENSKRTGTMTSTFCSSSDCKKDTVDFCDVGCVVSLNDLLSDTGLSWGKRAFGN